MAVHVRPLSGPDELETYYRLNSAAFGAPFDPAVLAGQRDLLVPERALLADIDGVTCGGVSSLPIELTIPGGTAVPASAVIDVAVLPTHRRRRVATALLSQQLADARDRGDVVAALHATEAGIYGRFGYGVATRSREVSLDTRRAVFRDDWPDPGGEYRVAPRDDPATAAACAAVHDRVRRVSPGGVSRAEAWWEVVLGDAESYMGGGAERQVIVHLDSSGRPDGYVIYEVDKNWSGGQAVRELQVWELLGETAAVEVGLWRLMCDHDLVVRVSGSIAVDHALFDVMADGRQARTLWEQDVLWLRLLDIEIALSHRSYASDGELTFAVEDAVLGDLGGTYALRVEDGEAHCERGSGPADLALDTSELSACLLGGGSFRRARRAGRVDELTPGAAARADEQFSVWPAPWCWVRF